MANEIYEVIHTETTKAESHVVFMRKNGRLERAMHLGNRGGFVTREEALAVIHNAIHCGEQNV